MPANAHKCAHDACKCVITGDDDFCSPFCEQRADEGLAECACGHDDCATSIGIATSAALAGA